MQYSASRLPSFLQSRTALIILGVAVLAIIIIILFVVLGGRNNAPQEDVSALPVSGISDTTDTGGASGSSAAVEIAPTSARVVYSVKSGDTCYAEIYTDGAMNAENLTGPAEKTVDVTGTWTITTWDPSTVKVTVDGQAAELKASNEYGGMYAYTVDFPAILKQWQASHGVSASSAAGSSAGSTSGSSSTTTQSTGTGSTSNAQSGNGTSEEDDGTNYVGEEGPEDQSTYTEETTVEEEDGYEQEQTYDETQTYDDGTGVEEEWVEYTDDGTGEYYEEYTEDGSAA